MEQLEMIISIMMHTVHPGLRKPSWSADRVLVADFTCKSLCPTVRPAQGVDNWCQTGYTFFKVRMVAGQKLTTHTYSAWFRELQAGDVSTGWVKWKP